MKIAVVTGASGGIGFELCKQLSGKGYEVIAIARSQSDELARLNHVHAAFGIDVTETNKTLKSIQTLLGERKIDLVIQNAGVFLDETLDNMNLDTIQKQMQINAYAPLMLTHALLPLMNSPSKVAMITSRMGSIGDNTSGAYYGYRASKAALNAFAKSLRIDLAPRNIDVAVLHPGFVSTKMVGFAQDAISPVESARGLIERIDSMNAKDPHMFYHMSGEQLEW